MRRLGIVAVAVLGLPLAVFAQRAGGVGGGAAVHAGAVSAPVAAARVSAPVAAHPVSHVAVATRVTPGHVRTSSPNRAVSVSSRFANSNFVSNDVPGLGFDYPHLAAVSPKGAQLGRSNRFRQTVPFGFGGFLISTPEIYVENPQAVEEAQETAADQGDPDAQAQFEAAQMQAYRAGQRSVAPPVVSGGERVGGTTGCAATRAGAGSRSNFVCICDARWRRGFRGGVFVGQRHAALCDARRAAQERRGGFAGHGCDDAI
jgi:hypothetical protein